MKPLVLALVLSGAIAERSLDVGLDVLPEAFGFAAHKVGFAPAIRLTRCTESSCIWDIGQGVEVAADHRADSLVVNRIEAKIRPTRRPVTPEAMQHFEKACLTIVALVDRDAGAAEQQATAKAIAASVNEAPGVQLELPERNIRFYGARSTSMTADKQDVVLRCGATATS